jgi:hypothetical protein
MLLVPEVNYKYKTINNIKVTLSSIKETKKQKLPIIIDNLQILPLDNLYAFIPKYSNI